MRKPYPILEFDPNPDAIATPNHGGKPQNLPEHCVICFFNNEIHKLHQAGRAHKIQTLKSAMGSHLVFAIEWEAQRLALFHPGMGGPLAAALLEEVIALGCRKFVACGSAGVLDGTIPPEQLLVPTAAVRDEGTSYHYLPPAREVEADAAALAAIERTLTESGKDFTLTKTWTTDAIYRETAEKIALRKSEGCLSVDMEAASLFAVAKFRGVSIGQILYGSDDVSGDTWRSRGRNQQNPLHQQLLWLAAKACLDI